MFLSSQQGRLRVDDGHGAIAPSLTSEHESALPVESPGRFQLGPAWLSFSTETEQAGLGTGDPEGLLPFRFGPFGPPPSLARFASLESPGKCEFLICKTDCYAASGSGFWRAGPDRKP